MSDEPGLPNPDQLPPHVRRKRQRDRRNRLFACACARLFWDDLNPACRGVVELVELLIDGRGTWQGVDRLRHALDAVSFDDSRAGTLLSLAAYTAYPSPEAARRGATQATLSLDEAAASAWHAVLEHDLYGQGETAFLREWQRPAGGAVATVALAIYQDRALPLGTLDAPSYLVLADALEEAGCASRAILDHCRTPGLTHVRGCWVVEGLLGWPLE